MVYGVERNPPSRKIMEAEINLTMQLIFEKIKSKFGDMQIAGHIKKVFIHIDGYSWHEDKFSGVMLSYLTEDLIFQYEPIGLYKNMEQILNVDSFITPFHDSNIILMAENP